ncbi:DUF72 domain-containing protein [Aquabacterium sp. A7-Y]|uniref:DUF72 domain-containing protein n=1 Tax=Aquabacterium sp. A7-Y TaxID=1349605 RepID=UPI00223D9665|nr:DUF72 domain-containing protein [Aquabacterium sp. A7-Y]MCW7538301.1 DUF72 domain-containing protein [Aquabacterium sp. A7-Y]
MIRIGTAGWSVPRAAAAAFPGEGSHLARYARVLPCAEINTSFYRPHQRKTYESWAAQVPEHFRFAVKLPRTITHEGQLRRARQPLAAFLEQVGGLGDKLGVLLVQLPPSFAFEARVARTFFDLLRELHEGAVVCEPRHKSWFEPAAERLLVSRRIGRVAADPARPEGAGQPSGWLGPQGDGAGATVYYRWHGSPRIYYSRYDPERLAQWAEEVRRWHAEADLWCIFDNTASGAAAENALELQTLLGR